MRLASMGVVEMLGNFPDSVAGKYCSDNTADKI